MAEHGTRKQQQGTDHGFLLGALRREPPLLDLGAMSATGRVPPLPAPESAHRREWLLTAKPLGQLPAITRRSRWLSNFNNDGLRWSGRTAGIRRTSSSRLRLSPVSCSPWMYPESRLWRDCSASQTCRIPCVPVLKQADGTVCARKVRAGDTAIHFNFFQTAPVPSRPSTFATAPATSQTSAEKPW
jgi:hypothetical protein